MGSAPGAMCQNFWWVGTESYFGPNYPSALLWRSNARAASTRRPRVALGVKWPFWRDLGVSVWLVVPGFGPWRKRWGRGALGKFF